jgi:hypothetical protein
MEPIILDSNLSSLGVLDVFDSLIWTDRYQTCGDFQIIMPTNSPNMVYLAKNNYLLLKGSEHLMVIESSEFNTDNANGNKVTIKGRSIESILDRRIIWNQTILTDNFQTAVQRLLNENAIICTGMTARKLNRLVFLPSTDPIITALTIDEQYTGDNLYNVISSLCTTNKIGFKIIPTDDGNFQFQLYAGKDRSYNQQILPCVIFSPEFENVVSSSYTDDITPLKTVTLVTGEGEGAARMTATVEVTGGGGSDLARREMYTNAGSISRTTNGDLVPTNQYHNQLVQKGTADLAKNVEKETFQTQIDNTRLYVYGKDFVIGDILESADEFGHSTRSQVTEFIYAQDSSGIKAYPTFTTVA